MLSEPVIRVDHVSKTYRLYRRPVDRLKQFLFGDSRANYVEVQALQDVSFSIAQGESVGVLGVNGSGKSTLLQVLCGALQPTGGMVSSRGRLCTMLELGAGFNPEFTGRENVYVSGRVLGMSEAEIENRYLDIVAFADIGDFIDRPVRSYSSGMYVRLAFAVAAHTAPDILLVDEVLAVGDIFFQQKCNLFMQRQLGQTAKILVTHSLSTVSNMTSRVLVLDKGRLVFDGPPLEGIEAYIRLERSPDQGLAPLGPKASSPLPGPCVPFCPIAPEKLSGSLAAVFTAFAVEVNDQPYEGYILAGARVTVTAIIEVRREIAHPIVGYLLADRYGNYLFGQNTTTAELPMCSMEPGLRRLSLRFTWPDIAAGDYFLTPGIGNGHAAMAHDIECWAHNIFHFSAVTPHKDVHGLFNSSLHSVECVPVSEFPTTEGSIP